MILRLILSLFLVLSFVHVPPASAIELPLPGAMVALSPAFSPIVLKGLKLNPKEPFKFDFVLSLGDKTSAEAEHESNSAKADYLKTETNKLIKYFLTALTVPEKDLWVNLSPYEKDRMIANNLGQTQMGQDMLAQDYILKQLTASLIYPESGLGKEFWNKIYEQANGMNVPVNMFNKVWIVADKADVFEGKDSVFVTKAHLKVLLETDYLALQKVQVSKSILRSPERKYRDEVGFPHNNEINDIVRQIIIPALEREVNEGAHFAPLRQMYYSMILASWYKMRLKDAILTQAYGNQSKVGVTVNSKNPDDNQKIYEQYLQAYKKGVFNFIKEDVNAQTRQAMPRKYFSGGFQINAARAIKSVSAANIQLGAFEGNFAMASVPLSQVKPMLLAITNTERKKEIVAQLKANNIPYVDAGSKVLNFGVEPQDHIIQAAIPLLGNGDVRGVVTDFLSMEKSHRLEILLDGIPIVRSEGDVVSAIKAIPDTDYQSFDTKDSLVQLGSQLSNETSAYSEVRISSHNRRRVNLLDRDVQYFKERLPDGVIQAMQKILFYEEQQENEKGLNLELLRGFNQWGIEAHVANSLEVVSNYARRHPEIWIISHHPKAEKYIPMSINGDKRIITIDRTVSFLEFINYLRGIFSVSPKPIDSGNQTQSTPIFAHQPAKGYPSPSPRTAPIATATKDITRKPQAQPAKMLPAITEVEDVDVIVMGNRSSEYRIYHLKEGGIKASLYKPREIESHLKHLIRDTNKGIIVVRFVSGEKEWPMWKENFNNQPRVIFIDLWNGLMLKNIVKKIEAKKQLFRIKHTQPQAPDPFSFSYPLVKFPRAVSGYPKALPSPTEYYTSTVFDYPQMNFVKTVAQAIRRVEAEQPKAVSDEKQAAGQEEIERNDKVKMIITGFGPGVKSTVQALRDQGYDVELIPRIFQVPDYIEANPGIKAIVIRFVSTKAENTPEYLRKYEDENRLKFKELKFTSRYDIKYITKNFEEERKSLLLSNSVNGNQEPEKSAGTVSGQVQATSAHVEQPLEAAPAPKQDTKVSAAVQDAPKREEPRQEAIEPIEEKQAPVATGIKLLITGTKGHGERLTRLLSEQGIPAENFQSVHAIRDHLATLPSGEHVVVVRYVDGSVAVELPQTLERFRDRIQYKEMRVDKILEKDRIISFYKQSVAILPQLDQLPAKEEPTDSQPPPQPAIPKEDFLQSVQLMLMGKFANSSIAALKREGQNASLVLKIEGIKVYLEKNPKSHLVVIDFGKQVTERFPAVLSGYEDRVQFYHMDPPRDYSETETIKTVFTLGKEDLWAKYLKQPIVADEEPGLSSLTEDAKGDDGQVDNQAVDQADAKANEQAPANSASKGIRTFTEEEIHARKTVFFITGYSDEVEASSLKEHLKKLEHGKFILESVSELPAFLRYRKDALVVVVNFGRNPIAVPDEFANRVRVVNRHNEQDEESFVRMLDDTAKQLVQQVKSTGQGGDHAMTAPDVLILSSSRTDKRPPTSYEIEIVGEKVRVVYDVGEFKQRLRESGQGVKYVMIDQRKMGMEIQDAIPSNATLIELRQGQNFTDIVGTLFSNDKKKAMPAKGKFSYKPDPLLLKIRQAYAVALVFNTIPGEGRLRDPRPFIEALTKARYGNISVYDMWRQWAKGLINGFAGEVLFFNANLDFIQGMSRSFNQRNQMFIKGGLTPNKLIERLDTMAIHAYVDTMKTDAQDLGHGVKRLYAPRHRKTKSVLLVTREDRPQDAYVLSVIEQEYEVLQVFGAPNAKKFLAERTVDLVVNLAYKDSVLDPKKLGVPVLAVKEDSFSNQNDLQQAIQAKLKQGETVAVNPFGGIDLDANKLAMNISKEGKGLDMHIDPAMLAQLRRGDFAGLAFRIENIVPIANLQELLAR